MTILTTKYEADGGLIHPIRMKKAAEGDFANTPPEGVVSNKVKVKISKNKRAFGISPRTITLSREVTTTEEPPRTLTLSRSLPILTPAIFTGETATVGATVKIDGVDWKVTGQNPEDY